MKLGIGITLVLVAALVGWLLLTPERDDPIASPVTLLTEQAGTSPSDSASPMETQSTADARRVEPSAHELLHASAAPVQAQTLRVRSSIGLELPFVEWQTDESDWQRIDLANGRCEIGPMKLPCLVRAPGHLASLASKAGEELVLEPDALLLVESSALRSCVSWIRPCDIAHGDAYSDQDWDDARVHPALRRAMAWGWISDTRWALAVSSALAPNDVNAYPIEVAVRWRDGRRAEIRFIAKAGTRGTWPLPCGSMSATADLEVSLMRPDAYEAGPVSLRLMRLVDGVTDASSSESHEWGQVVLYGRDFYRHSVVAPAGADSAHFDSVPIGTHLSLAARDDETSAYGRLVFVHDGADRRLELRSGFEITGRVVSSTSSARVSTIDWSWQFRDGKERVWGWHADAQALAVPPDGSFRLRGPDRAPIHPQMLLDPPAHLLLRIESPGFESFERTFDTGGATHFDCGEVRLVPRRGEIALAPGHGLTPQSIRWYDMKSSAAPEVLWHVRDAVPLLDGALELFLLRSEKQPALLDASPGGPRAWPDTPAERIVIHVQLANDDEPWAFERGTDGRYVAVTRRQIEAEVECRAMPSEGKSWFLGWQWHELWDTCEQVPAYELGKTVRVSFSIPAEGATFYWSASGNPPRAGNEPGGSLPIEALPGRLVLQ